VRVGAYVALRLGPWSYTSGEGGAGVIQAEIRQVDDFWGTQPATVVELDVGARRWRWALPGVDARGGTLRVSGPPEVR
jgi:hypothetical protein